MYFGVFRRINKKWTVIFHDLALQTIVNGSKKIGKTFTGDRTNDFPIQLKMKIVYFQRSGAFPMEKETFYAPGL